MSETRHASSDRHQTSMPARFVEEHMRRSHLLFAAAAFGLILAPIAFAELAADASEVASPDSTVVEDSQPLTPIAVEDESVSAQIVGAELYDRYHVLIFLACGIITWSMPQSWDYVQKLTTFKVLIAFGSILGSAGLVLAGVRFFNGR